MWRVSEELHSMLGTKNRGPFEITGKTENENYVLQSKVEEGIIAPANFLQKAKLKRNTTLTNLRRNEHDAEVEEKFIAEYDIDHDSLNVDNYDENLDVESEDEINESDDKIEITTLVIGLKDATTTLL
jgi:hypothetical protein